MFFKRKSIQCEEKAGVILRYNVLMKVVKKRDARNGKSSISLLLFYKQYYFMALFKNINRGSTLYHDYSTVL